ncbi:MAG: hypothetical protein LAT67_05895 [Balneolales bacterium]|nr:hypothetical protein [Balneolales bacterium]
MASNLEDKLRPDSIPIYYTYKAFKWDQFFVGLFGALAIFGVLMKLWDEPFWGAVGPEAADWLYKTFMPIGFLGECVVFIIMGFIKGDNYVEVYPTKEMKEQIKSESESLTPGGVTVNMQLPDSLKQLVEKKLTSQIDVKMQELSKALTVDFEKTQKLLAQTNQAYTGLNEVGQSLSSFSKHLIEIDKKLQAFDKLDASVLSNGTAKMSKQLDSANAGIQKFETELSRVADKFKKF